MLSEAERLRALQGDQPKGRYQFFFDKRTVEMAREVAPPDASLAAAIRLCVAMAHEQTKRN